MSRSLKKGPFVEQKLYDRINLRVDEMVKAGLVEEARQLWQQSGMKTAANAIGYKELIPYFEGTMSLEDCIDKIKQETRRYAKRQLTWFLRDEDIHWFDIDTFESVNELENAAINYAEKELKSV